MSEKADIEQAIEALESQRSVLGNSVVDEAIRALVEKLAALQSETPRTREQRKLVTIVFCDMVGFTSLSETMDPETIREILNSFFTPWYTVVSRYNGKIEKFIGDAVMAVFGIPWASEDDPEQAIRAALDAREMLIQRNEVPERKFGRRIGFRIGINTGNVLVGELGREGDFTVTGDAVNLASRIQAEAPENGILISHDTYRHVRGVFDVGRLTEIKVRGKTEPVVVYEVYRAKPRAFRIASRGIEGLETKTIGRERAHECLEHAWRTVTGEGEARLAIISGDAGIGKSRLLYDFRNWMELHPDHFWILQGRSSNETRNQPYSLIRDIMCFRFQISETDDAETRCSKLEAGIVSFLRGDEQGREMAHFIGQLIGFDFSGSPHVRGILHDPGQIRDRAVHAFIRLLDAATATDPLVAYLEDIHWADQGSLSFLNTIGTRLLERPVLIVSTARPEFFKHSSGMEFFTVSKGKNETPPHVVDIRLEPLSDDNTRALLLDILRLAEGVPEQLLEKIAERSEGNPFYIEEFVKMLIDDTVVVKGEMKWWVDSSKLEQVNIPPTLTGLLQARLDRLPDIERGVLQRASVIGRVFWNGIVAELCSRSINGDGDVNAILESLCGRELIRKRDDTAFPGNAEYVFHHSLIHDVAYESVLKKNRRIYHGMIGRWLVLQHDTCTKRHAGIIAVHFDRAGDNDTAASWYVRAAEYALDRYANDESLRYVDRSLELVSDEDLNVRYDALLIRVALYDRLGRRDAQRHDIEEIGRIARELNDTRRIVDAKINDIRLGIAIGDYSMAIEEAEQTVAIAREEQFADLEALALQLWGEALWRTGDLKESHTVLSQARALAREMPSLEIEAGVLRNLGAVSLFMNEYEQARAYFEEAVKTFRDMKDRAGESATLNNLGLALYYSGKTDEARDVYEQAYSVFRMIGHRHGESAILINLGLVANQQEDFGSALRYYSDALDISRAIRHRSNEILAMNNTGFVLASLGKYDVAQDMYEQALDLSKSLDEKQHHLGAALNLGILRLRIGDYVDAMELFERCFRLADEVGIPESQIEAITYEGHAYLEEGEGEKAEKKYRNALDMCGSADHSTFPAELLYGLMKVTDMRGDDERAFEYAEELISKLPSLRLKDSLEPIRLYLGCYELLNARNDPRVKDVLHAGYTRLRNTAEMIEEDDLRRSFLENVPHNKALMDAWNDHFKS